MSKFSDICTAYSTSRTTYFEYRDRSFSFAGELIRRYVQYLEIPAERFRFVPLNEEPKPNTTYTLAGAIHLDDDTYWHLGLQIMIFTSSNAYPQQPVLIRFMFKAAEGGYHIRISENDDGHVIHAGNETEFTTFFDFLQLQIRQNFLTGLQCFLEQSAPLRTIGFIQCAS